MPTSTVSRWWLLPWPCTASMACTRGQDLVKLAERVGTEPRIIEGADHFFFGKLFPLGTAVEGWLRGWVPGRAS